MRASDWRVPWAAALGLLLAAPAIDSDDVKGATPRQVEDHSAHVAQAKASSYKTSAGLYATPDVVLTDERGDSVSLQSLLDGPRPVALNFIFTTCTTICPVMTATFSRMRRELGPAAEGLELVSISIDPEHDTPSVLRAYATRYGAGAGWRFLTGDAGAILSVLKAFDAFTGSKMNHRPVTLFRVPGSQSWVRIEGLASGSDLAGEYRRLVTPPPG